jgi:hypothetical protein
MELEDNQNIQEEQKQKGGAREGAGRPKGSKNKDTKMAQEFLMSKSLEIMEKIYSRAMDDSDPESGKLLAKLGDKIIPNVNVNQTQHVQSIDLYIKTFYNYKHIDLPEEVKYQEIADTAEEDIYDVPIGTEHALLGEGEDDGREE